MNKQNNVNIQSKVDFSESNKKNNKNLSNLNFEASLSEIKDNKELNNTGNILNVSYLSIINKKDKDNNFSATTKNDEYRSTDNVSTKSKKKKLIKVFMDSGNFEMDKTLKYEFNKSSKESSDYRNNNNNNYEIQNNFNVQNKHEDRISNYFSNDLINENSQDLDFKDYLDFFETENKGLALCHNRESFLQSENQLKSLVFKFEKSRTKSFAASHIRRNSNFSLNLNFKKEFVFEKNLDQNVSSTNFNIEKNNLINNLRNYESIPTNFNNDLNNNVNNQIDIYENLSNLELSKLIFEKINKSEEITEITLPARYISLPFMNIKKNLKIKGSPGTLLEIKNGFILINQNISVSFSECSFVFNYEQSNFIQKLNSNSEKYAKILSKTEKNSNKNSINNDTIYSISCIKLLENSQLEINDCDFRSIVHENEEIFESENKLIRETLINCALSDKNLFNDKTKLILNSSIFSNFSAIVEANFLKFICVDNCHFSEISSTVLTVSNFLEFCLENSIITNVQNALEIQDCEFIKKLLKLKVSIRIKRCQIYLNEKNAIVIKNANSKSNNNNNYFYNELNNNLSKHLGNKNNSTNDIVEITKNKIFQNQGMGISIENFIPKTYEIIENQIEENLQGNILINSIHKYEHSSISSLSSNATDALLTYNRTISNNKLPDENFIISNSAVMNVNYSEYDFIILKNEIKNSYSAFGLKMLNCTNIKVLIEHNRVEKNLIGIHAIANNSVQLFIKNTILNSNLDSGVVLLNNRIKSNFNFYECCISKNVNFGIQANNNFISESVFSNNKNIVNETFSNNEIKIHKGEINLNNIGLGFESLLCKIDRCRFIDNKSYAIQISEERFKENLKLFNYEKNYNILINTPIGGSWGLFNGNDKCVCQSGKCVIF